ncbi:MAG: hypothetical protein LC793_12050, partial [Thermomicrobia bacterium]|nr:hypothetical protein [Thermomicrobia bacterium]
MVNAREQRVILLTQVVGGTLTVAGAAERLAVRAIAGRTGDRGHRGAQPTSERAGGTTVRHAARPLSQRLTT